MFNNLVADSKNEVKETFKDYNSQIAYKINLLMNMLTRMQEQKMKLIPHQTIVKELLSSDHLLKIHFEKTRSDCSQKLKILILNFEVQENIIKIRKKKQD